MAQKDVGGGAGNNTVIGQSILISGKLTGDEDLTVQGRVEGELTLTRTLIVEPTGVVKANVAVKNAIISGVVVGNINATESVELTREGRMVGDIRAPRVIIVDGASFRGRVDMGDVEPGRLPAERPARPVVRPQVRPGAAPPRPPPPPARSSATTVERKPLALPSPAASPPRPPPPPAAPASAASAPKPQEAPTPPLVGAAAKKKVIIKKKTK
ncbi:MAG TPA: polymer-forming cytoskeletal protein [Myxococcaceae bacterium]|jgi:cytoskeletal protein CcmA (bactofilin family)